MSAKRQPPLEPPLSQQLQAARCCAARGAARAPQELFVRAASLRHLDDLEVQRMAWGKKDTETTCACEMADALAKTEREDRTYVNFGVRRSMYMYIACWAKVESE